MHTVPRPAHMATTVIIRTLVRLMGTMVPPGLAAASLSGPARGCVVDTAITGVVMGMATVAAMGIAADTAMAAVDTAMGAGLLATAMDRLPMDVDLLAMAAGFILATLAADVVDPAAGVVDPAAAFMVAIGS